MKTKQKKGTVATDESLCDKNGGRGGMGLDGFIYKNLNIREKIKSWGPFGCAI